MWGAVGVVKMYNFANVSFKRQSTQIPRIKYFCACIPPCWQFTYFLCLKNRHITIIDIFRGTKTHDAKKLRDFKNFFLIHLTFIKNILNFKINRSTKIFMFNKRQTRIKRSVGPYIFDIVGKPTNLVFIRTMNIH